MLRRLQQQAQNEWLELIFQIILLKTPSVDEAEQNSIIWSVLHYKLILNKIFHCHCCAKKLSMLINLFWSLLMMKHNVLYEILHAQLHCSHYILSLFGVVMRSTARFYQVNDKEIRIHAFDHSLRWTKFHLLKVLPTFQQQFNSQLQFII